MKFVHLKIRKNWVFWVVSLFFILAAADSSATIRNISVSSNMFSPQNLNAFVGDTIRWNWVDGFHTTTSTSVPAGAASWNSPMDPSNTTFTYVITQPGTYNYWCVPHSPDMFGVINATVSGITQQGTSVPDAFSLSQNYPNPFNPATTIKFNIASASNVLLQVYDITGKAVSTLANEQVQAGNYTASFDASQLPSGNYIYKLTAFPVNGSQPFIQSKRMTLIK